MAEELPMDDVELTPDDLSMEVIEELDGSATIPFVEEDVAAPAAFGDNLAATLPTQQLDTLASSLSVLLDKDKEARKQRDKLYEEGIQRTGMGDDAPGGADFAGASRAVHPMLAEGCVDYAARAIREIFPPNGPVKTKIYGEADTKKLERARRKANYLNWQMTRQIVEYRSEKEILLTQLPLGGSQYEKYWYDHEERRPRMEFVPVDKVLLPYSAGSFYAAKRMTHMLDVTREKFEERITSGFYVDVANLLSPPLPEETAAQKANDKVEGREDSGDNPDGLRLVFEISVTLDLENGDGTAPYVIHLDEDSNKIAAIYRNWQENDDRKRKLDWWVEDKFIPWRGVYGIGLPHLIGGLAAASTGALRALLDSAHINNSPGAVKLKGGRVSGGNIQIAQTQVQDIDAPAGVDDIRKVMMPLPFNPPSSTLFQLLEWITAQAKGVVATTEERMDQVGDRTPVGTTMAMIEQGSATYSAIHARLHESQERALAIICRLNVTHPDLEAMQRFGVTPDDFKDTDDICPVSDPHIFSEAQRYAQLQEEVKLMQVFPNLNWNANEMARRALALLRVDGIDSILPKVPEPITTNAASENLAMMKGVPAKAVPEQDHLAHIMAHLGFIINPINTLIPGPMPQLGGIMEHIKDHLLLLYQVTVQAQMVIILQQSQANGRDFSEDQLTMRSAQASQQMIASLLSDVAPLFQQAGQVIQSKTPPPPMDPAVKATYEVGMAEVKRKAELDKATQGLKMQESQTSAKLDELKLMLQQRSEAAAEQNALAIATMAEETRKQIAMISEAGKQQAEEIRQQVEMLKNEEDNRQHQLTELMKNHEDNQTNYLIAQMKQEMAAQQASTQEVLKALLSPQPPSGGAE